MPEAPREIGLGGELKRIESRIALMTQDENEISGQMKPNAKKREPYRRRGRHCVGNVHGMKKKGKMGR